MWKCVSEPGMIIIALGAYECDNCGKRILAMPPPDAEKYQSSIANFKYCPFCGTKQEDDEQH